MDKLISQIAQAFKTNHIHWAVGGSKLLAYYNITSQVNDLDLIVDIEDHQKVCDILSSIGKPLEIPENKEYLTERFSRFIIQGIEIDLMSEFRIKYPSGIFEYKLLDHPLVKSDSTNHFIPLCSLEQWYLVYLLLNGRQEKVVMMESYFQSNGLNFEDLKKYTHTSFDNDIHKRLKTLEERCSKKFLRER